MVGIRTFSLLPLAVLLLMAGLVVTNMAHAESAKPDAIPPDIMRDELGEKFGPKLKAMSPEARKAFIEQYRARQNEARKQFQAMTPEQRAQAKALREKLAKATPEERAKMRDTLTETLPKLNDNKRSDIPAPPAATHAKKPAPPVSGEMLPAGH